MRLTADTSVLVAGFASWHEHHAPASAAVGRIDLVIAHCLLETYSVLTRLPPPHRMTADVVSEYLERNFGRLEVTVLPGAAQRTLVSTCADQGITGGSIYDALIGATSAHANARLLTLDGRARQTYAVLGVDHDLLA